MHINLEEDKLILDKKIIKLHKLYDYIVIGSGPAASVVLNNLIKEAGLRKNLVKIWFQTILELKKNLGYLGWAAPATRGHKFILYFLKMRCVIIKIQTSGP